MSTPVNGFVPDALSHKLIAWYRSMTASVKSAFVTSQSPRSDRTKLASRAITPRMLLPLNTT